MKAALVLLLVALSCTFAEKFYTICDTTVDYDQALFLLDTKTGTFEYQQDLQVDDDDWDATGIAVTAEGDLAVALTEDYDDTTIRIYRANQASSASGSSSSSSLDDVSAPFDALYEQWSFITNNGYGLSASPLGLHTIEDDDDDYVFIEMKHGKPTTIRNANKDDIIYPENSAYNSDDGYIWGVDYNDDCDIYAFVSREQVTGNSRSIVYVATPDSWDNDICDDGYDSFDFSADGKRAYIFFGDAVQIFEKDGDDFAPLAEIDLDYPTDYDDCYYFTRLQVEAEEKNSQSSLQSERSGKSGSQSKSGSGRSGQSFKSGKSGKNRRSRSSSESN